MSTLIDLGALNDDILEAGVILWANYAPPEGSGALVTSISPPLSRNGLRRPLASNLQDIGSVPTLFDSQCRQSWFQMQTWLLGDVRGHKKIVAMIGQVPLSSPKHAEERRHRGDRYQSGG